MAMFLILISVCTGLAEGLIIKKYNAHHPRGSFVFTAMVSFFAMLFFMITDTDGMHFIPQIFPYALISGVFYSSASVLTFEALACGSYVMSMLILSYSLVFSITYGLVWLREPAGPLTYLGLAMILVSVYLTRGEQDASGQKASLKWLVCILISFVGNGVIGIVGRMQQIRFDNSCTNEYMVIVLAFSTVVLLLFGIMRDGRSVPSIIRGSVLYAGGAGIANGATNLLGLAVNMLIPISIAAPSKSGLKIILSFLFSVFVFKEKFLKRQWAGIFVGTIALVLLNL